MRRNASRDEYVPQHGDKYEVKDAFLRGHGDARIRVAKIAAFAMLALAVIILGVTVKTYASERTAHSDASTVQAENAKVSKSKEVASQALSAAALRANLSTADFNDIPTGDTVQAFSLAGGMDPVLADDALAALQDALGQAQEMGDVGVVFYDLSSGKGVTYNADVEVYGASSYKALYALYICESLVETGQVSLDDSLGPMVAMVWAGRRCAILSRMRSSTRITTRLLRCAPRLTMPVTRTGLSVLASITTPRSIR